MPSSPFKSPLIHAVFHGDVELTILLLDQGANIEDKDEGFTALMVAAGEGHEEIVALLLSRGAQINALSLNSDETALAVACSGGHLEVADLLLREGADIELGNNTPLMQAAQHGHLAVVRYLIVAGADIKAKNAEGDTALTLALGNNHTRIANFLQVHISMRGSMCSYFYLQRLEEMVRLTKMGVRAEARLQNAEVRAKLRKYADEKYLKFPDFDNFPLPDPLTFLSERHKG